MLQDVQICHELHIHDEKSKYCLCIQLQGIAKRHYKKYCFLNTLSNQTTKETNALPIFQQLILIKSKKNVQHIHYFLKVIIHFMTHTTLLNTFCKYNLPLIYTTVLQKNHYH